MNNTVLIAAIILTVLLVLSYSVSGSKGNSSKGDDAQPVSASPKVESVVKSEASQHVSSETKPREAISETKAQPTPQQASPQQVQGVKKVIRDSVSRHPDGNFLLIKAILKEEKVEAFIKDESERREVKAAPKVVQSIHPIFPQTPVSVRSSNFQDSSDLFTVKTSVEEEFGITEEELDSLAREYKARHLDYEPREFPRNPYINMKKIEKAKEMTQSSMTNLHSIRRNPEDMVMQMYKDHSDKILGSREKSQIHPAMKGFVSVSAADAEKYMNIRNPDVNNGGIVYG